MKEKTCCFTGHREIPPSEVPGLTQRLEQAIEEMIAQGVTYFGAGGAMGFDTLAAQAVVRLKAVHPAIKLILVLPCRDQDARWNAAARAVYRDLLGKADKIVYTSERYDAGCMHKRNRHLVDHSAHCICHLTKMSGGSFYTVEYAKSQGLSIIYI